jgi:two-component system sensor histidine kinase MprB
VFDRFYRAAGARRLPGSGLGLAIVRQVAEAHGASVAAANADGGGASFALSFPAELVSAPAA